MSGPKGGLVIVGGYVAALAAIKLTEAAVRGAQKVLEERQNHKGNMLVEIASQECPVQKLLANGQSRWQSEQKSLNTLRSKVNQEISKLRSSSGVVQAKKDAEDALRKAEDMLAKAESHNQKFNVLNATTNSRFQEARDKSSESQRSVRSKISDAKRAGDQALSSINQAVEMSRSAKLVFEETLLIIQLKADKERQNEIQRQNAQSILNNAISEIETENMTIIHDWLGDEETVKIQKLLKNAESAFKSNRYDSVTIASQEAISLYRKNFEVALQTKQKFENREIIADAIVAALLDIQYDEPDVNYEPKDGIDCTSTLGALLGNITIFAKSKGESGDMRLAIDLDGKVNLDVANIPDGKESECHSRLSTLQSKVADVVDFEITDWGRAKNVKKDEKGGVPKIKVQENQKVRQRLS